MQGRPFHTALHLVVAVPRHRSSELLHALSGQEEFVLTRSHSVKHLEDILDEGTVDAALIAEDLLIDAASLPRLLRRSYLPPIIILTTDPTCWPDSPIIPIDWDSDTKTLIDTIHAAIAGEPTHGRQRAISDNVDGSRAEQFTAPRTRTQEYQSHRASAKPVTGDEAAPVAARVTPARIANVIAVVSGAGAPGRTTIALNLAAALGLRWPTTLLDADTAGPSLPAVLGSRVEPSRNLLTLAYSVHEAGVAWDEALAEQTQVLDPSTPDARVLCGLPAARIRGHLPRGFLSDTLAALAEWQRWVIVDVGTDLAGEEAGPARLHRAALAVAGHVILVAAPEALGIQRARQASATLVRLGIPPANIAVVLNGWDRRLHNTPAEIAWALGEPLRGVIPFDPYRARRALAFQHPLVFDRRSRAGKALLALGGRISGGHLHLSPKAAEEDTRNSVREDSQVGRSVDAVRN